MKKKEEINEIIFSNDTQREETVKNILAAKDIKRNDFWIVWIKGDGLPGNFSFPPRTKIAKVFLIFESRPINPANIMKWREWAEGKGAFDVKVLLYGEKNGDLETFLSSCLGDVLKPQPDKEACAITRGDWVKLSDSKAQKGDPSLLTLMFGKTGELISYLDWIRVRFRKAYGIPENDAKKYLEDISKRLEKPHPENFPEHPALDVEKNLDTIHRMLLLGETGVGKTLFAKCLAGGGRFARISIPEYLAKEDMFEYDMFGYAAHSYSDADPAGSRGVFLNNIGGVIFLDEIGEASPVIQTKLLAFLDDYKVRPRGWSGKGFYCPVLIVGATNQPLDTGGKEFRNDLIQRFTDIQTIPPLRERMENFHLLLDCLLQNKGINIDGEIKEIGENAYKLLSQQEYKAGNFRELENLVRTACRNARMDGRTYLVKRDFE